MFGPGRALQRLLILGAIALCAGCSSPAYLWTVEAPGKPPSHLLGTFHLGVALEQLPEVVHDAFEGSQALVMEIDLRRSQARTLEVAPGQRLDDLLTAEQWRLLRERLPDVPEDELARLHPLAATNRLWAPWSGDSMDVALFNRARDRGLALRFLEEPDLTESESGEAALQDRVDTLVVELEDPGETRRLFERLGRTYLRGRMERYFTSEDLERAEEDHELFTRTAAWLPALNDALDEGGVFVAVGLAHMLGPKGLVAALRERGYRVERAD